MSRTTQIFVYLTTFVVLGTVVLGSIVCVTDSSAACPNWPGCYEGQITPEFRLNPMIEFIHRVFSVSCAPAIIITGFLLRHHADKRMRFLPWLALLGACGAGIFGMLTIKRGLSSFEAMLDLWCAFLALVVMGILAANTVQRSTFTSPKVGLLTTVALFLLHGFGILVAGTGSFTRCVGWPLGCNTVADHTLWLQVVRIALALSAVIGIVLLRSKLVSAILAVEVVLGLAILSLGLNDALGSAFSATAAALLLGVAYQWGLTWFRPAIMENTHTYG